MAWPPLTWNASYCRHSLVKAQNIHFANICKISILVISATAVFLRILINLHINIKRAKTDIRYHRLFFVVIVDVNSHGVHSIVWQFMLFRTSMIYYSRKKLKITRKILWVKLHHVNGFYSWQWNYSFLGVHLFTWIIVFTAGKGLRKSLVKSTCKA